MDATEQKTNVTRIETRALRALAQVAPKKDPRKGLAHAVHIGPKHATATNGRIMLRVPHIEQGEECDGYILDVEGIASDIAKNTGRSMVNLTKNGTASIKIDADNDSRVNFTDEIEGHFPQCESVIPSGPTTIKIAFNPNYMLALMKAIITLTKGDKDDSGYSGRCDAPVIMEIRDLSNSKPIRMVSQFGATTEFEAILMPRRIKAES